MKTLSHYLNEEENKVVIKKEDFRRTLSAIISNFKRQSFEVSKDNVAKAFITLHSFIGNTIPEKTEFPEERIEKLYNDLFSEYRNGKEAIPPKISYFQWKDKMAKIYLRDNNGEDFGEGEELDEDKFQDALDNTAKGIGGAALAAALTPVIGPFFANIASVGAKVTFTSISRRLDRKGCSYTNLFSKFLDCFRDTIDSMTEDLAKIVRDNEYSSAQMLQIEKDAGNINAWWTSLVGSIETEWNDSDAKVNEFMKIYLDSLKEVSVSDFDKHEKMKTLSAEDIEFAMDTLINNINLETREMSDKEKAQELMKTFCLFSLMSSELSAISPKLAKIKDYVKSLYDLLFSKYNEYGKKLESPKIDWNDLVAFFNSREKFIDDSVQRKAKAESAVKEAEEVSKQEEEEASKEELEDMENRLKDAINKSDLEKDVKKDYKAKAAALGNAVADNSKKALQGMLYDVSIWIVDIAGAKDEEAKAEKVGALFGKIVNKFTTKFAENTGDPLINQAIGNIGVEWIYGRMQKIWKSIKEMYQESKEDIQAAIDRADNKSIEKISKIVVANNLTRESKTYIMTREQFLNEEYQFKVKHNNIKSYDVMTQDDFRKIIESSGKQFYTIKVANKYYYPRYNGADVMLTFDTSEGGNDSIVLSVTGFTKTCLSRIKNHPESDNEVIKVFPLSESYIGYKEEMQPWYEKELKIKSFDSINAALIINVEII